MMMAVRPRPICDNAIMSEDKMDAVVADLADKGWSVIPNFMAPAAVAALRVECQARSGQGLFHRAGVGRGQADVISAVRGDAIQWIEADDPQPAVRAYLETAEALRTRVNREFFLGLAELEAHFAVYPPGAFYKKHLDRFRDDDRRSLTIIVYLNEQWHEDDGGQLRVWTDLSGEGPPFDVLPEGGTLVAFLSDRFWHEVLPARRQRMALTGWFKRR
jgi:SM-20-related protein